MNEKILTYNKFEEASDSISKKSKRYDKYLRSIKRYSILLKYYLIFAILFNICFIGLSSLYLNFDNDIIQYSVLTLSLFLSAMISKLMLYGLKKKIFEGPLYFLDIDSKFHALCMEDISPYYLATLQYISNLSNPKDKVTNMVLSTYVHIRVYLLLLYKKLECVYYVNICIMLFILCYLGILLNGVK